VFLGQYSLEVKQDSDWIDIPIDWRESHVLSTTAYVILSKDEMRYPVDLSWIDYPFEPGAYRLCIPYQLGKDVTGDEWKRLFFEFTLIP
jgi:hypothetical protein